MINNVWFIDDMIRFTQKQSLDQFQEFNRSVYAVPDDRNFSLGDLVSSQIRFTMRSLKGMRKKNRRRLTLNLLIAFSFTMAICNRLHINAEEVIWNRFPMKCSYCGNKPCSCKKDKTHKRIKIVRQHAERPGTLSGLQRMFNEIYPANSRSLSDAGIHLAEESGEVFEAVKFFRGEHKNKQFESIALELSDWISCMFGVANSAGIDVAKELEKLFAHGCHVCHESPCVCTFSVASRFNS